LATQVTANPTVVQAQATTRANVARAIGGLPDHYFTTRTTSGVSSIAGSQQMGIVKCITLVVIAVAVVVVVAILVDIRFSNY
jgi:hypothetical protein